MHCGSFQSIPVHQYLYSCCFSLDSDIQQFQGECLKGIEYVCLERAGSLYLKKIYTHFHMEIYSLDRFDWLEYRATYKIHIIARLCKNVVRYKKRIFLRTRFKKQQNNFFVLLMLK